MRFDACAQTYDASAAPQRAFAGRVAEFANTLAAEDVLELGAGTGALTRWLCRGESGSDGSMGSTGSKGAVTKIKPIKTKVRATDASEAMIHLGRKTVPEAEWFVLDAFAGVMPQSELQVSSGLLQWAPDPVAVLGRWATAVRPGGRMIHAFPCDPCLREWRSLAPESPLVWRDEKRWCEIFKEAGLHLQRQEIWLEQQLFGSAHEMLRSLHRSGVTGQPRLGPGRLRRTLRNYDQDHRTAGGVMATWAWMAVECQVQ